MRGDEAKLCLWLADLDRLDCEGERWGRAGDGEAADSDTTELDAEGMLMALGRLMELLLGRPASRVSRRDVFVFELALAVEAPSWV